MSLYHCRQFSLKYKLMIALTVRHVILPARRELYTINPIRDVEGPIKDQDGQGINGSYNDASRES